MKRRKIYFNVISETPQDCEFYTAKIYEVES